MITIISGTNRTDSETILFAKHFQKVLTEKTKEQIHLFSLEDLPLDFINGGMYEKGGQTAGLTAIQDEIMIPADKFLFVLPEYNGGFPGILKLFLDACSVREYKATFKGKKAALVGVATGRAGNLRGLDHMTGVLNHVGTVVMPNKLPISSISKLKNGNGEIHDVGTLETIDNYVEDFLLF